MNYCSLEDAWGKSNYISDQYNKYDSNDVVENFDQTIMNNEVNYAINDNRVPERPESTILKPQNKVVNKKCVFTCDDFIDHMNKCAKCRMKLRQQFSSKIGQKIKTMIFYNKDTILLFLIGLFFLIFLNLLLSVMSR